MSQRVCRRLRALTAAISAFGFTGNLSAATVLWQNTGTGNWNDTANWVTFPTSSDDARINNGGTAVIDDTQAVSTGFATMGTATGESGTLTMTGGTLTTSFDIRIGGNATTGGGTGIFNLSGGKVFMNGGNFNSGQGPTSNGTFNMSGGSLQENSGTIFAVGNRGTGTINQSGGTIYVRGGTNTTTSFVQLGRNATTTIGNGTYNLSGGTLAVALVKYGQAVGIAGSTNAFNLKGGTLLTNGISIVNTAAANSFSFTSGSLTVNSIGLPINNTGGTLNPATADFSGNPTDINSIPINPIGTTTFTDVNDYTQGAGGTLAIDIAGPGSNDRVDIGAGAPVAAAILGGTIAVNTLSGFDPALGDTFDILYADSIADTALVTGLTPSGNAFEASVRSGGAPDGRDALQLTVVAAPEPGAVGLLGLSATAMFLRRRRLAAE